MIVNKNFAQVLTFSLLILFAFGSCKKKKAFKEEDAQTSVDVRMFQGQTDQALADINQAIMGQSLLRGRNSESSLETICGLDQDTSLVFSGIIRLIYNGTLCNGVIRTGTVMASIQEYPLKKWKNAGTILKIDFMAYKAVWPSDGRTIQIDGTGFLQNESGKTWYDLQYLNSPNLVQVLTGDNIKGMYSKDNVANYNLNRRMEYSFNSGTKVTTCRVDGLGSSDGASSLENWGFTRDGKKFTNRVSSPMIWKTSCGALAPLEGELVIDVEDKEHDLICSFSIDKDGNTTNSDAPCPYGMQIKWSYKNKTNTRNFGYN